MTAIIATRCNHGCDVFVTCTVFPLSVSCDPFGTGRQVQERLRSGASERQLSSIILTVTTHSVRESGVIR